ncbi:MAG TPA: serpin family protein [Bdellovibrionota bacterium]|jgi:serpin B
MKQKNRVLFLSLILFSTFLHRKGANEAMAESHIQPPSPITEFGCGLYRELAKKPGNLFFSPYSVSTALAMTSAGAKGKTLAEMRKTLHLGDDSHTLMRFLRESLSGKDDNQVELVTANRLWAKSGQSYDEDFLQLTESNYGAGLTPLDYAENPEDARQEINEWVEKQTKSKIKDLMPKGSITAATDLVLTNAIYFKGSWSKPFSKEATRDEEFHPEKGKPTLRPFMHLTEKFPYGENKDFQFLRMNYKSQGNGLSMLILLPKKGKSLASLEKKLTAAYFQNLTPGMGNHEVKVSLPKFRLEYERRLEEVLPKMGMKLAFDAAKADFSGIRELKGTEHLSINVVAHKAFVDVDETGTEAAAATGVGMVLTSAPIQLEPPKVFQADRPFLFVILHAHSNAALFMGRVAQP